MAFVVEDGSGKADANSYASVAEYKAHCDARGISYAGYADASIEADLVRGADHLAEYRARWIGTRKSATQALDWPRYNAPIRDVAVTQYYADDEIPTDLKKANIELAIRGKNGATLRPDLTRTIKREKTDVLETEYADGAPEQPRYQAVEVILEPLLMYGGVSYARLVRG